MEKNERYFHKKFLVKCVGLIGIIGLIGVSRLFAQPYGDITFLHVTDLHYANSAIQGDNENAVDMMNTLEGSNWHNTFGGDEISNIRGVIVSGDITDNTSVQWFDTYAQSYDPEGSTRLIYPAYETWGNHDDSGDYILDALRTRIPKLNGGNVNIHESGVLYSWDWDNVHFVCLGIYPSNTESNFNSLQFLIDDLEEHVGDSRRPVVLFHHYDFFPVNDGWNTADREAAYEAASKYNVIAWLVGHQHVIWKNSYPPTGGTNGNPPIDVFNAGTAKGYGYNTAPFLLYRITENELWVSTYRNGTTPNNFQWSKVIENDLTPLSTLKKNSMEGVAFDKKALNLQHYGTATVILTDMQGREIYKEESTKSRFDFSQTITNGVYLWRITMKNLEGSIENNSGRVVLMD